MKKIIFATGNEGKLKEIRTILRDLPVEVLSLKEADIQVDIVEDGATYEANALIKVRAIRPFTDAIILADDSGLEVDYLDKAPGVLSARFMGEDTSYTIKNQAIIDQLNGVEQDARTGRFVCAIAASFPNGNEEIALATMEGVIAKEIVGKNGFGYDPIFYLPDYQKTSAELTPDEKNKISHRGKALRKMAEILKKRIVQDGE